MGKEVPLSEFDLPAFARDFSAVECDICGKLMAFADRREVRTPRPSDPSDWACVLFSCAECGEGKTPAEWSEWIESDEARQQGALFLS